jgi:hypothetical protein
LTEDCFAFLASSGIVGKAWAPPAGMSLQAMEKSLIASTLERANGNIKESASILWDRPVDTLREDHAVRDSAVGAEMFWDLRQSNQE